MLETGASMSLIPVWVDRSGKEEPIEVSPNEYNNPIVSPNGTQVAMTAVTDGNYDIWVWDLVRETMSRLTLDGATDAGPVWTPDGKRIAFTSNRDGSFDVYWVASDGTGDVEPLFRMPDRYVYPASWSADGDTLVLMEQSGSLGIGAVSMGGDREHQILLQEDYNETQPEISPDGRWMVYQSDESGQYEIYIRPFPDVSKGKTLVSTAGGTEPKWSPDGRELFYRNGDAVMVVSVRTEPTLSLETPEVLLRGALYLTFLDTTSYWNVSADGKRFLIIKESRERASSARELMQRINIVLNWFEELKQKVPVD